MQTALSTVNREKVNKKKMKTLIVTTENQSLLEGGRIGYGSCYFRGRRAAGETYEVRLSAKAAAYVEVGDSIDWWDSGASEYAYQGCKGEIIKKDGRRIQLEGSRDLGIDTGHSPHLGLKMIQKWGVKWTWEYSIPAPKGLLDKYYRLADGSTWEQTDRLYASPDNGKTWETWKSELGLIPWECPRVENPKTHRIRHTLLTTYEFYDGTLLERWGTTLEKKTIQMVDTDRPLIL